MIIQGLPNTRSISIDDRSETELVIIKKYYDLEKKAFPVKNNSEFINTITSPN